MKDKVKHFYSTLLFPALLNRIMDQKLLTPYRKELLAEAKGEILEIGFGTGSNLAVYAAAQVRRLTAVEPNPGMEKFWNRRIHGAPFPVEVKSASAEELPFPDGSFDQVVSTFTLCSVGDDARVARELFRVLKRGGKLLVLEHGKSPDPAIHRWQCRLNRLNQVLADGCHLERDIPAILQGAGFQMERLNTFYLKKAPKTHGYLFQGSAIKPL